MTIELNPVTSGYSTGVINDNFDRVEEWINLNALWRQGTELGQANQMEQALDMNSYPILNATTDTSDSGSLITVGDADTRYVNTAGDTMEGALSMSTYPITVRVAIQDSEPARKDELDSAISGYQSADANIQTQLIGNTPLEASAFSEISWHGQVVENSVSIPDNKNAWSIGPTMSIASGQSVTIGAGSSWTIVEGNLV